MEREIGRLQASMDSLHDKVDGIEERLVKEIDKQETRITKLEGFRIRVLTAIGLSGTGVGAVLASLKDKLHGVL